MTDLATFALAQFHRRRAHPVPDHEARLRPWAAAALRVGADPAQVSPDAPAAIEDYRRSGLSGSMARVCVADDLCPPPALREELARARDRLVELSTTRPDLVPEARQMAALADTLGCRKFHPAPLERIAA